MVTAKHFWEMSHAFDFCSAKFNFEPTSVIDLGVLEGFDTNKNYKILIL